MDDDGNTSLAAASQVFDLVLPKLDEFQDIANACSVCRQWKNRLQQPLSVLGACAELMLEGSTASRLSFLGRVPNPSRDPEFNSDSDSDKLKNMKRLQATVEKLSELALTDNCVPTYVMDKLRVSWSPCLDFCLESSAWTQKFQRLQLLHVSSGVPSFANLFQLKNVHGLDLDLWAGGFRRDRKLLFGVFLMTSLKELRLRGVTSLVVSEESEKLAEALGSMTGLQRLSLTEVALSQSSWQFLVNLRELEVLELIRSYIATPTLVQDGALPNLEVQEPASVKSTFACLVQLSQLRYISLRSSISARCNLLYMAPLLPLIPALNKVKLLGEPCVNFHDFCMLSKLTSLHLGYGVTGEELGGPLGTASMPHLRELTYEGSPAHLQQLLEAVGPDLPHLSAVSLTSQYEEPQAEDIACLENLPALKSLHIATLSLDLLLSLPALTGLERLSMENTEVLYVVGHPDACLTKEWLQAIAAAFPLLRELNIAGRSLDGSGLGHLQGLSQLKKLVVGTEVVKESVVDHLPGVSVVDWEEPDDFFT